MGRPEFHPRDARPAAAPARLARGRSDDGVAVEVDGGVNRDTIRDVFGAGANILVAGSAIFGAPSPGESFRELTGIVAAAGDPAWV